MKILILAFSIWSCQAVRGQMCSQPSVPNAQPVTDLKTFYNPGETHRFVCDSGYVFEGTKYALCEDGTWKLPVCKHQGKPCAAPLVPNAKLESYTGGSSVRFVCDSGYGFEGTQYALCEDGTWSLPVCKISVCGSQPFIEDGDVTELPGAKELKVQCKMLYKLVGPDRIRCVEGKWTALPVCKPPCLLDKTRIHSENPSEYLQEGERKRFYCPESTSSFGWKTRYIQCSNGIADYGECLNFFE